MYKNLHDIIKERIPGKSIKKLCSEAGIDSSVFYHVSLDPKRNIGIRTVETFYKYVFETYGVRIPPWEYLDVSHFKSDKFDDTNLI